MTKLTSIIFIFSALICIGCKDDNFKVIQMESKRIRSQYASQLKKMPKINYLVLDGVNLDERQVELGRQLFNDPILSRNNDVSCATCHLSNHGFADGNSLSVGTLGIGGPTGNTVGRKFGIGKLSVDRTIGQDSYAGPQSRFMFRNSPSTINILFRAQKSGDEGIFWDGRFGQLGFQTLLPIHTAEEMCGFNYIPLPEENLFKMGGVFFKEPVEIKHSHHSDYLTGRNAHLFNARPEMIKGVPSHRPNGSRSVPNRNECLAITVAKIRSVPAYQKTFDSIFKDGVTDLNLASALASFVKTHIADDAPYDRFIAGEDVLSEKQLLGLELFINPLGKTFKFKGEEKKGMGCIDCHAPPFFGGDNYASLAVRSDKRSPLTVPKNTRQLNNGFFATIKGQRGKLPKCHIEGVTIVNFPPYGPDIGRANKTLDDNDCFKFRVPPLRNVIETFPYYHHGTETAEGYRGRNHRDRTLKSLMNVIDYHLRGPVNVDYVNRFNPNRPFFDVYLQRDILIPLYKQQFTRTKSPEGRFPHKSSLEEREALLEFIAYGLWDTEAVVEGSLGNDLSHPKVVPSGFSPSITRDKGHQLELPPNSNL